MSQLKWQDRVRAVANYHSSRCKENPKHRIANTAEELKISLGSVSEAIQITSWMRTHPKIEDFEFVRDALKFIRDKKAQLKLLD